MLRASMPITGLSLALAFAVTLTILSGCSAPAQRAVVTQPTGTVASTIATHTEPNSATETSTSSPEEATAAVTTAKPATKPKPAKPPAETVTKTSAASAIKKAVNSMPGHPIATVTSVDVKVLEKADDGTWWAGADAANDVDGAIVFAKKPSGGSWVIVDAGTGISGSDLAGKAPAAIVSKFEAAF